MQKYNVKYIPCWLGGFTCAHSACVHINMTFERRKGLKKKRNILRGIDFTFNAKPARKKAVVWLWQHKSGAIFYHHRTPQPPAPAARASHAFWEHCHTNLAEVQKPQERRVITKFIQRICITDIAPRQSLLCLDIKHLGLYCSSTDSAEKQGYPLYLLHRSAPLIEWPQQSNNQHHCIDVLNSICQLCALRVTDKHK